MTSKLCERKKEPERSAFSDQQEETSISDCKGRERSMSLVGKDHLGIHSPMTIRLDDSLIKLVDMVTTQI